MKSLRLYRFFIWDGLFVVLPRLRSADIVRCGIMKMYQLFSNGLYLALDTSGSDTSVALFSESSELVAVESEVSETHSTRLEVLVKKILQNHNELRAILLGTGPGSFTGLRISFAFAKGLALGSGVGIFGIPTLTALGCQMIKESGSKDLLVLEDARRQEYFATSINSKLETVEPLQIVNQEWIESWKAANPEGELVSSDKLAIDTRLRSEPIAKSIGNYFFQLKEKPDCSISASQIAALTPDYIRAVSALSIAQRREKGLL